MAYEYISLAIGAPARLAILRRDFAQWYVKNPHAPRDRVTSWRDVRFANLRGPHGLGQGFNGDGRYREPVWYTHDGAHFRHEQDADKALSRRLDHTGWYTDDTQDNLAIGIVAALPHGRWLAGYRLTNNDERVYFAALHDTKEDAARMADEHARVYAEQAREDDARYREAQSLEDDNERDARRLAECRVLRHNCDRDAYTNEARDLLLAMRSRKFRLATEFKDVL